MQIDLSVLEDFQVEDHQWIDWRFNHQQYENIPLAFFNRFNKTQFKCCDLSSVPIRKDEEEFTVVQGNTKVTNKEFISKNIKMGDRRKNNQASTRTFTKKQRRGLRTWHNQYKTKFKQLTVKNDWKNIKTINKRDLSEHVPKIKSINIQNLSKKGKLHKLNQKVQKISWNPIGIKQMQEYKLKSVSTLADSGLAQIAQDLMNSQQPIRKSVVCSIEFLLAILTVRGGQYPWVIHLQKQGNLILLENQKKAGGEQQAQLTYLDMFTANQNTTNNMPSDQGKIRDHCITATKYTQVFKDLLSSGQVYTTEGDQQSQQKQKKEGQQKQEDQEAEQELDYVKKYVKIQLDDIDIYTAVRIDGIKIKNQGQIEECLIRAFVETSTDGAWIQDIKKTQGTLVFQEYLANSCSLQKWICQGRLAGIELMKLGFIGFDKQKPKIINVAETTLQSLEKHISFKETDCWPVVKYIFDIIYGCDSGTYVLARSAYTPLAIKLFNLPVKEQEQEQA